MCTFSLAVAIGAALLLPVSIASNEVLLLYPNSYYVKWLNSSLIQGKILEGKGGSLHSKLSNSYQLLGGVFCCLFLLNLNATMFSVQLTFFI